MTSRFILSSQYFLYFGTMGIFLPYFNLYLYHLEFTGLQIGTINAIRSISMVIAPIIWSIIADRYQIRRGLYILLNFSSAGLWALFLLTTDFFSMCLITAAYGMMYAPIISFLEAFTMDVLGGERKRYGKIRVWGSVAFISMVLIMGKIMDKFPISILIYFILIGSLLLTVLSIFIPEVSTKKNTSFMPTVKYLFGKRVVVFLFCAFLMLLSHGAYYGFFSIHLETLGYDHTFIGIAWALASISEIVIMLNSNRILSRFSLKKILIFSFAVAMIRWIILFGVKSPFSILASQTLHAITYGTFHISSILYMDSLAPDEAKTMAQAANNAITYGLGLMAGFLLNGYLYEPLGSFHLFLISSGFACIGGIILMIRLK